MGGSGNYQRWIRPVGVTFCMVLFMTLFSGFHWTLLLSGLLMYGAQTTYFKKGPDAKWFNWLFVGLAFSFCMIPYVMHTGHWLGFLYRTIVVTAFVTIWSEGIGNAVVEESGRGAIQILTLPIL